MAHNIDHHHRRSIRLVGYDYSQAGSYFVTICTHGSACLFGDVRNGEMVLNDAGQMVQASWDEMPVFYPGVDLDAFVVMPNHIHGIIVITGTVDETYDGTDVGATPRGCPPDPHGCPSKYCGCPASTEIGQPRGVAPTSVNRILSLPDVVHRFKTITTKRYSDGVKLSGWMPFEGRVWQRNYYEHIIRNGTSLNHIRQYISCNPEHWTVDRDNSCAIMPEPKDVWRI